MKLTYPNVLELARVKTGFFATIDNQPNGLFEIRGPRGEMLRIIASNGEKWPFHTIAWEHVSVSLERRCPTWEEMCFVKDLFWEADETVIQFHPPEDQYKNLHKFCLHLWKPIGHPIQLPPTETIAP